MSDTIDLHISKPVEAPARRVEVFTGAGRRRRWSAQDKAAIVADWDNVLLDLEADPMRCRDRLDWVAKHWSRIDQRVAGFTRTPAQQLCQQMAFTPFVFENVGDLIDQSSPDLYLFSSDYPHVEGGRDPIARFEKSLGDRPDAIRDRFYAENFLRIFPAARAA